MTLEGSVDELLADSTGASDLKARALQARIGGVTGGWVYDALIGGRFASHQSTPQVT